MSRNNKRHLEKIRVIQKIWVDNRAKGVTTEFIYNNLIAPHYYIARSTFYNYLTVPVNKLFKE